MLKTKHQWVTFTKGRVKVKACAICGELQLPSNADDHCENADVYQSQIVKAGYRVYDGYAAAR
ncbi:hypothetical protein FLL45_02895 [Aliikangiella marina]|uniref:Uncharacterized protein n=1 Tax=Aliikangiella marina TaxID=1712262 RepID=A0A545TI57_9GAMM|nr:hypothetical protein [Aliikangiella marina]TQV76917.1 hypothetical protein FLL45_02895 [Aliikangiella marina]